MSNKQLTELGEEVSGVSGVPKGWAGVPMSDVASWGSGGTPSRSNSEYYGGVIPWIKTGELGGRYVSDTEEKITELGLKNSSAKLFEKGSVAIAMYGATIGKTSILAIDATTNQACGVGKPVEGITTSEYLYHYLSSQKEAFIEAGKGGAQPNISQTVIKDWPIPLAPLSEQKRIVDKLDATLARVDACRERLARVTPLLKRFRQSVLAAATSGQLTADWREQQNINATACKAVYASHAAAEQVSSLCPTGPTTITADLSSGIGGGNLQTDKFQLLKTIQRDWTSYPVVHLSQVADSRLGKMLDKAKNSGQLTPYLGNINVRWFAFNTADLQEIKIEERDVNELSLRKNDVLICEGGEPGRCAIWEHEGSNIIFQKALHRVRPLPEKLLSTWLVYSIKYAAESRRLDEYFTGTTIKHFTGRSLAKFELPLPPLPEQTEIVRRVETLFAFADRMEARLTSANAAA
ncbi:MAG: restriction endonuclease subunit S, partial [Shewanella oncorhynchi]